MELQYDRKVCTNIQSYLKIVRVVDDSTAVAITEVKNGVGWIKINRPEVLNSINMEAVEIISSALEAWKYDEEVALICMYGEGERGLCAGGDMRKFL